MSTPDLPLEVPTGPVPCLVLFLALALGAFGCAGWPLYAQVSSVDEVNDDDVPVPELERDEESLAGLDADPDDGLLPVSGVEVPSVHRITGSFSSCGFDPDATWPDWPEHLVDADGDGEADPGGLSYRGWYLAEVDIYEFAVSVDAVLSVRLEWANAPSGDSNSPVSSGEPEGAWAQESDLDFVIFEVVLGELTEMVSDAGFSLAYPEQTTVSLLFDAGDSFAVAVGCHHSVPSDYVLTVDLDLQ